METVVRRAQRVRRRGSPVGAGRARVRRGAATLPIFTLLASLLLPAPAAAAHPNASSTPLTAGRQATVTVLMFADEGPTTGFAITVPAGVRLDGATGDRLLPLVSTAGATAAFRGGLVTPGEFVQLQLLVTPVRAGELLLAVRAQLQGVAADYVYPLVRVTGSGQVGDGAARGWPSRGVLLTVALLALGALLGAARLLRRGSRQRRAPAAGARQG